ncbi:MAG TPA: SpoIIE family protein phosphatase [Ktedonobacteraceae bacterium]|nr:SpoIIE family protein phosphatase [Ktedonobacteraceae bacterium]
MYRCLGEHASVEVDNFQVALQPEDVLVLCSDGMWEMVRDDEIQRIIETSPSQPSRISNQLIQAALAHGGADNVSVIVICIAQA